MIEVDIRLSVSDAQRRFELAAAFASDAPVLALYGHSGAGKSLTLQAIAAVLIGGTSLFGGTGTLVGTLVGGLILTVVLNGMNILGVSANWQPLITGVIVILSVLSDAVARKRRGS